eukprot:gene36621-45168_t
MSCETTKTPFDPSNSNSQKSTILITGGASGIGLAIGQCLLALGHTVITAGRRQDVLDTAAKANPGLKTIQADVATDAGRVDLFNKTVSQFPEVNVLFNNAGITGTLTPLLETTPADWEIHKDVVETNLMGTLHLSILFAPHLGTKPHSAIINNTSSAGIIPYSPLFTYSATKAALHSFSQTLRYSLRNTSTKVVEILAPSVETGKGASGFGGMDLDVYSDDTLRQLLEGAEEIAYQARELLRGDRDYIDSLFKLYNP